MIGFVGTIRKTASMGFVAVFLAAAGSFAQTTQTISFKVGGTARSGVVHVPAGVNKPPVVFFVHGYGGNGAGFANDTKADKVADREKFIAVYPSANGGAWSMYDTSEYPFLRMLLDTVDARYKIDRNRVYCAGFSQGGFISFGLGYKHPEIFAAVAPVSGHIPSFSTAAALPRPVPMFLTFGTNDISNVASFMADVSPAPRPFRYRYAKQNCRRWCWAWVPAPTTGRACQWSTPTTACRAPAGAP